MSAAATVLSAPLAPPLAGFGGLPRPTLAWNFRRMGALPPSLGFSRAGSAWRYGADGLQASVATGKPVFEHEAAGRIQGLRVEGGRTNLCIENVTLSALARGNATTVTSAGSIPAPDGTTGGVYRIQMPASTATFLRLVESIAAGTYATSCWVRSVGASSDFQLYRNGGGALYGPVLTATPTWKRFASVLTSTASGDFGINNGDDSYATDVYVWRPQVELAGFESSQIVTSGAPAARAADDPAIDGLDELPWFAGERGTWLVDWIAQAEAGDFTRVLELNDGSSANQINLSRSGGNLAFNVVAGSGFQASLAAGSWSAGRHRAAFRYAPDDFAVCLDGGAVASDADGTVPPLSRLLLGHSIGGSWSYSTFGALAYWPVALSDAALRAVTTQP